MKRIISVLMVVALVITMSAPIALAADSTTPAETKQLVLYYDDMEDYKSSDELDANYILKEMTGYPLFPNSMELVEIDGNQVIELSNFDVEKYVARKYSNTDAIRLWVTGVEGIPIKNGKTYIISFDKTLSSIESNKVTYKAGDTGKNTVIRSKAADIAKKDSTSYKQEIGRDKAELVETENKSLGNGNVPYRNTEWTVSLATKNAADATFEHFFNITTDWRTVVKALHDSHSNPASTTASTYEAFKAAFEAKDYRIYFDNYRLAVNVNYFNTAVSVTGGDATVALKNVEDEASQTATNGETLKADDYEDSVYTITPAAGYAVKSATYAGAAVTVTDNTVTIPWESVTSNTTLAVTVEEVDTFTVNGATYHKSTLAAAEGGSATVSATVYDFAADAEAVVTDATGEAFAFKDGAVATIAVTPDSGMEAEISVNGAAYELTDNKLELTVTEPVEIKVTFSEKNVETSVSAGDAVADKNYSFTTENGKTYTSDYTIVMYGNVTLGTGKTYKSAGYTITNANGISLDLPAVGNLVGGSYAIRVIGAGVEAGSYTICPYIETTDGDIVKGASKAVEVK